MSEEAKKINGEIINISVFDDTEWYNLKKQYKLGELKMTCCGANAIPKTSQNFTKFFAHHNDECATAPETIWHKTTKSLIIQELRKLGIEGIEEKYSSKWTADIFFTYQDRKIVIEVQHSPQTFERYLERQKKYEEGKIECYWLLHKDRFHTVTSAIKMFKLKFEHKNKLPQKGLFPCLKNLPILYFDTNDNNLIKGVNLFQCSIEEWIIAIISNSFIFEQEHWKIKES